MVINIESGPIRYWVQQVRTIS